MKNDNEDKLNCSIEERMVYQGIVKDRMNALKDRQTKKYNTFLEAHQKAEILNSKHFSEDRGEIDVISTKRE